MDAGAGGAVPPADDSWVATVHASETGGRPLGCGIVIDQNRILTCAHVADRRGEEGRDAWTVRDSVWVTFPKANGGCWRRLRVDPNRVIFPSVIDDAADLAVLHLREPVPAGVVPAPLRCPSPNDLVKKPDDLTDKWWWAFGFPDGSEPAGDAAEGMVGAALAYGWIRLDTKAGSSPVARGFSGGGVWSPNYRAVVAVVSQARGDMGYGRAITLYQVGQWFPGEQIRALAERWSAAEAGEEALSAWGWSLASDQEGTRHWRPRARGVSIDSERGFRFRGRTAALEVIRDWLDRDQAGRRVLVVTGSPGTGKSAVLGRIVTTADAEAVSQLPASDTGVRASSGSVGCAVHAKGKTALEVAAEIARAASGALPEHIEDFAPALRGTLSERGRRFNVIIDALDEAASPAEARAVIGKVIVPLAETCADVGAQVVVGSRRADGEGDLLGAFGGAARLVDLDSAEFFAAEDLADYALATLQLAGNERHENPYNDDRVAIPVAARIAELSGGNFLVAGLTARTHGLYDGMAVDPGALSFSPKVDDAMREYLRRVPPVTAGASAVAQELSAEMLLTALAFAEAPGLPAGLWRTALRALGAGDVPEAVLTRFAKSSAAGFLVESSNAGGRTSVFRLFHQALNDALRRAHALVVDPVDDERALTRAYIGVGRDGGWENADTYLLRALPAHAARAGLVDDLLADDNYLLHADLRRVLQVTDQADSTAARDRARLLGHTPEAVAAGPSERTAMFGVTEALDGLGTAYRRDQRLVPYRARWAVTEPRYENLTLRDTGGQVLAMCAVQTLDSALLATISLDRTVRLWDPVNGSQVRTLLGHTDRVTAVCAVQVGDRTLVATSSNDGTVRLWDPVNGSQVRMLEGHTDRVTAVCAVQVGDRTLLATGSGSSDCTVRLWDPATGEQVRVLKGHERGVRAVCAVQVGDRTLLATGSADHTGRLWDPIDGSPLHTLEGHTSHVAAVCAVQVGDRTLLATSSDDGTVRLWDPENGTHIRMLESHEGQPSPVGAICALQVEDRTLLATGSHDGYGTVRLWDPSDGSQMRVLKRHADSVSAVCTVQARDHSLLAAGSDDGTVGVWDLRIALSDRDMQGRADSVDAAYAVCTVQLRDRIFLAVGSSNGTAMLRNPADGTLVRALECGRGWVHALCPVPVRDRTLLATGSYDGYGTVRLWDPATGEQVRTLKSRENGVRAMCVVPAGNRVVLAVGGSDHTVRLWDPVKGSPVRTLQGHTNHVTAVCLVQAGDRTLLASGSWDRTVRLWDPATGAREHSLTGHEGWVTAVCSVQIGDRTLLASGSSDGTVRLWDPLNGARILMLESHASPVNAICEVRAGNRTLLASGSDNGTVRLFDPSDGDCVLTVPVHHPVWAMTPMVGSVALGLRVGSLVINFEKSFLR